MRKRKFMAMLVVATGFVFCGTSCTADFASATDSALATTASDEAQAAILNNEVINEADQYVNTAANAGYMGVKSTETASQPTITISVKDSVTFPKTIVIDFGTTGFIGKRGNVLKGKLIVEISDRMWKANASKKITFDNFSVNDKKISGSKTVTNKGLNASNHPYWTISVSDTITRTDGTQVIWNSERTRERIDNGGTPLILADDKYSISGSSNGVNAKGKAYTMTIDESNPLIVYSNYPHFVQGAVTITSETKTAVLDYGIGTKDNKATVTINGKTKNITLKN
ncbi:MAG: hypothetical protein QM800_04935 [Paludibacter sp.]